MNINSDPPSSVELKTLSTLRTELQYVDSMLRKAGYDDIPYWQNVHTYLESRINLIANRLK